MADPQKKTPPPADSPKGSVSKAAKVVFIITVVVCAILIPILILNSIMIVKLCVNPDEAPSLFGYAPRMVTEEDLEPDIMKGDIIFGRVVDPSEIKVGDTILFFGTSSKDRDKILVQKVSAIVENDDGSLKGWNTNELGKEFKGDENATTTFTVPAKNLVGVWEGARVPVLADVMLFMQSIPGMIICVVIPMLLIIGYEILREKKEKKQAKADTAALMAELEALRALQNQAEQATDGEEDSPDTPET